MARVSVYRPGNATLGIETNHRAGVHVGEMIFVGTQADIGEGGALRQHDHDRGASFRGFVCFNAGMNKAAPRRGFAILAR